MVVRDDEKVEKYFGGGTVAVSRLEVSLVIGNHTPGTVGSRYGRRVKPTAGILLISSCARRTRVHRQPALSEYLMNHITGNIGQPEITTTEVVRQFLVIHAQ